jgi:hypothetical protein
LLVVVVTILLLIRVLGLNLVIVVLVIVVLDVALLATFVCALYSAFAPLADFVLLVPICFWCTEK